MRPDTPRRCAISSTSAIYPGPRRRLPDGQEAQSPRPAHEGSANAPGRPGAGLRRARGGDLRHLADPEATGLGKAAKRGLPVPAAAQDAQACPQREPRALRMKALIGEMQARPTLDLDDPALPPHRMEVRRLGPTPSGP